MKSNPPAQEGVEFARVRKWKDNSPSAFDPVWFVDVGGESTVFTFERDAREFADAINSAVAAHVKEKLREAVIETFRATSEFAETEGFHEFARRLRGQKEILFRKLSEEVV